MDNTELNPGTGGSVMSDEDIGGVHVPRVKLVLGVPGVDSGNVAFGNPLPVRGGGAAGVPTPDVLTIQGIAGGFPVPVMGPAALGGAMPPDGFASGFDGGAGAMQPARVFDADSGAGSQYVLGVILRASAPGGSVEAGTAERPLQITAARASAAARSSVSASAADVLLLAANASRLGALVFNHSDSPLFLGLGATPVSITDFSILIAAQQGRDLPANYVGEVRGIWSVATGAARMTEITA